MPLFLFSYLHVTRNISLFIAERYHPSFSNDHDHHHRNSQEQTIVWRQIPKTYDIVYQLTALTLTIRSPGQHANNNTNIYTDFFCSFFSFFSSARWQLSSYVLCLCRSLSLSLLQNARSIKEKYAAAKKANIYFFFLVSLSSHTRTFVILLVEELGRWRCIGSDRRRRERTKVIFLFKSVCTHTQH